MTSAGTPTQELPPAANGGMANGGRLARTIGLPGAVMIGIGAIVGGGVLALAGVAFSTTGPGAIVAFALNGLIAALTALSFAELAAAFPESGGSYTYARKVLSTEAAFLVGWVVWLASIVAAVLYALGFASYTVFAVASLGGEALPAWVGGRPGLLALAAGATLFYAVMLYRKASGGGAWATIGKMVVFGVLLAGGFWALGGEPAETITARLRPFFPGGAVGLFQAMGYTFIALQGFDLIAAVGGEVRDPQRTIPRAMLISLACALAIYLPFLFITATVGVDPGESIVARSAGDPATVVALAARRYLGSFGFWLIIVAAILSMLSALQANLMAASRVALSMARDRTLPLSFSEVHPTRGTPVRAIGATVLVVLVILVAVADVAVAGAVSSLIFLLSFALTHGLNILTQQRGGVKEVPFRVPWFPLVPAVGGLACLALGFYQGVVVPAAGLVAILWLGFGFALYFFLFAHRAGVVDASAEGLDPDLVRLRGRAPLVLVPIAKPASAVGLAQVAHALAPPQVGRVLLLSVLQPPGMWERGDLGQQLGDVEAILGQTMTLSLAAGSAPEYLTTVASDPWPEMARVARIHRCESLLLGLGALTRATFNDRLEELVSQVQSDVVVLRAPEAWELAEARRVLVPVGGRRDQSQLRARLLASLCRMGGRHITYLRVLPPGAPTERLHDELVHLARDEVPVEAEVKLLHAEDIVGELVKIASGYDLVVLGLQRPGRRRRVFGEMTRRLAEETSGPLLLISRR